MGNAVCLCSRLAYLRALAAANIPNLGSRVATSRHEHVLVSGANGEGHDVAVVVAEGGDRFALLDVPVDAGGVAGGGDDVLRGGGLVKKERTTKRRTVLNDKILCKDRYSPAHQ